MNPRGNREGRTRGKEDGREEGEGGQQRVEGGLRGAMAQGWRPPEGGERARGCGPRGTRMESEWKGRGVRGGG